MTQTVEFVVTGEETIHCPSCEQRIRNALRRVPGVQDVRASAQTQQVVVILDPEQVSPEQVRARLQQLGYEVTERPIA
jgi:copper chaperone CopZ